MAYFLDRGSRQSTVNNLRLHHVRGTGTGGNEDKKWQSGRADQDKE